MDATILIFTICLYILSIVSGLLLGMISGKFKPDDFKKPFIFHIVLIAAAIAFQLFIPGEEASDYILLTAICSGVSLSGWVLRSRYHRMLIKIYFSVYLLSIPIFLWSPSLLFYSISGHYSDYRPEHELHMSSNYYLTEQQSMLKKYQRKTSYKIIRKFGIYNKTLIRNIPFEVPPVEASLEEINPDSMVLHTRNADGSRLDYGFKPGMKKNIIERKSNNKQIVK